MVAAGLLGAIIGSFLNVVAYRLPRGRCRSCDARIPARYPLVEAGTGLLCALVALAADDVWLGLAFVLLLVPVTLIDLDHKIIPNRLMLIGAVVAPAILAVTAPGDIPEHLIAAVAAGGVFLLAAIAYPRGMGMGDVKLAAVMGLFLGRSVAPAMFVALIAGTLVGALVIARKGAREGRKTAVPFGPFLAFGGLVGILA